MIQFNPWSSLLTPGYTFLFYLLFQASCAATPACAVELALLVLQFVFLLTWNFMFVVFFVSQSCSRHRWLNLVSLLFFIVFEVFFKRFRFRSWILSNILETILLYYLRGIFPLLLDSMFSI